MESTESVQITKKRYPSHHQNFKMTNDGSLLVKRNGKFHPFNYQEFFKLSKENQTFLNKYSAFNRRKKGNEDYMGEIFMDILEWFYSFLSIDPAQFSQDKIVESKRKVVYFDVPKETAINLRILVNQDNIVNLMFDLYRKMHPLIREEGKDES